MSGVVLLKHHELSPMHYLKCNKEEESVKHAFEPSINCSESNVTSA